MHEDQTAVPALHLEKDCACDLGTADAARPDPRKSCTVYAGCEDAKWEGGRPA